MLPAVHRQMGCRAHAKTACPAHPDQGLKSYSAAGGHLYGKDFDEIKLLAAADTLTAADDFKDLTTELLTATIALTHPDVHSTERKAEAQRVTQELIAIRPFVFPAPEPEPSPKERQRQPEPADTSSKHYGDIFSKLLAYPCEDCRDTVPSSYCDPCRAQWEKEQQTKRERDERKRVRKNVRQRQHYRAHQQARTYRAADHMQRVRRAVQAEA